MKRVLCASFVLPFALSSTALAQSRTNFSGTWSMDPTRSASQVQNEPIGPVTVVITQTPTELKIATTRAQVTTTEVYTGGVFDQALSVWFAARLKDAGLSAG